MDARHIAEQAQLPVQVLPARRFVEEQVLAGQFLGIRQAVEGPVIPVQDFIDAFDDVHDAVGLDGAGQAFGVALQELHVLQETELAGAVGLAAVHHDLQGHGAAHEGIEKVGVPAQFFRGADVLDRVRFHHDPLVQAGTGQGRHEEKDDHETRMIDGPAGQSLQGRIEAAEQTVMDAPPDGGLLFRADHVGDGRQRDGQDEGDGHADGGVDAGHAYGDDVRGEEGEEAHHGRQRREQAGDEDLPHGLDHGFMMDGPPTAVQVVPGDDVHRVPDADGKEHGGQHDVHHGNGPARQADDAHGQDDADADHGHGSDDGPDAVAHAEQQ